MKCNLNGMCCVSFLWSQGVSGYQRKQQVGGGALNYSEVRWMASGYDKE